MVFKPEYVCPFKAIFRDCIIMFLFGSKSKFQDQITISIKDVYFNTAIMKSLR